jgi:beta-glucosidase/6-phospho-beta-glucosidase/beta-galactosidase
LLPVKEPDKLEERRLFSTFFGGGFECSSHRLDTGKRLDLVAATGHDRHAAADYRRLRKEGMRTAREGIRWHLIEKRAGHFDFTSVLPMIRAAEENNVQVIWDLCHYGYPDDVDIFKPHFVRRFAALARAFTTLLLNESDQLPFIAPVNEISYWAWAGGDMGYFNPCVTERSFELKVQLVRATIEAIEALWSVEPRVRIVHTDPAINVVAHPQRPADIAAAEAFHQAQYQAWDMVCGYMWPQLGGAMKYLDILGINYYPKNQWIYGDKMIPRTSRHYRPFRHILKEIHHRYGRPLYIAETGDESETRPEWLRYVCDEVQATMAGGIPVHGICLYPILNHYHWEDGHYRHSGLWGQANEQGERSIYMPLAEELRRQRHRFEQPPRATSHQQTGEGGHFVNA